MALSASKYSSPREIATVRLASAAGRILPDLPSDVLLITVGSRLW